MPSCGHPFLRLCRRTRTGAALFAQAFGRLGNYFNQELYGPPTTLPWGLQIHASSPAFPCRSARRNSLPATVSLRADLGCRRSGSDHFPGPSVCDVMGQGHGSSIFFGTGPGAPTSRPCVSTRPNSTFSARRSTRMSRRRRPSSVWSSSSCSRFVTAGRRRRRACSRASLFRFPAHYVSRMKNRTRPVRLDLETPSRPDRARSERRRVKARILDCLRRASYTDVTAVDLPF